VRSVILATAWLLVYYRIILQLCLTRSRTMFAMLFSVHLIVDTDAVQNKTHSLINFLAERYFLLFFLPDIKHLHEWLHRSALHHFHDPSTLVNTNRLTLTTEPDSYLRDLRRDSEIFSWFRRHTDTVYPIQRTRLINITLLSTIPGLNISISALRVCVGLSRACNVPLQDTIMELFVCMCLF